MSEQNRNSIRVGTMVSATKVRRHSAFRRSRIWVLRVLSRFSGRRLMVKILPSLENGALMPSATGISPCQRSACSVIRSRKPNWICRPCKGWKDCIDNAHHFGATCVAGFTGRIRNKPLPESLPRYREVWSELAKRAADKGIKIAFENCAMDGNWATR